MTDESLWSGERTDGGGREQGELELSLLRRNTSRELRLSVVIGSNNLGLALLDLGVVGAGRGGASLDRLGVGLELLTDGSRALSDGLGNDGNLDGLLRGEREPVGDFSVQLLLAGQGVGGVEERRGGGDNDTLLAKLLDSALNSLNGTLQVGLPDVSSVDNTSRQDGLGAKSTDNGLKLLRVADKVDVNSVDVLGDEVKVVDDVTKVGGEDELGDLVTQAGELLIGGLESSLGLGGQVEDENRLINLDGLGTSLLELDKELLVDGQKLLEQVNGLDGLATVGLSKVQEAHRANKDGAGDDTSLLGLVELNNSLGGSRQLKGLVVLESGLNVVVVGVKPLNHLQRGDIDASLLVATAHGEVLVNSVKAILGVALGDSL